MRYFIDRSLGSRILPGLLREDGWLVETMDERYGVDESQSIADARRIGDLGDDELALTSDRKIGKVPVQAEAIRRCSARIVVIGSNMTGRGQAQRLIARRSAIEQLLSGRDGPWVISLGSATFTELRLPPPLKRHPIVGT